MMVVDSSAIIAILFAEPASERLEHRILDSTRCALSAASLVETGIVALARHGDAVEREVPLLLRRLGVEIVPVTAAHAEEALDAFRRFGKGRHPAALNFGDCFSYALARALDEPLLFLGHDFSQTDIAVAPY